MSSRIHHVKKQERWSSGLPAVGDCGRTRRQVERDVCMRRRAHVRRELQHPRSLRQSSCMVGHPDRPKHNGFMAYTNETRGALKKLIPTCQQPTAQELAKADAFKKKQQEILDANTAKANPQAAQPAAPSSPAARRRPRGRRRPRMPRSARCAAAFPPAGFRPPAPATRCWALSDRWSRRFCLRPPRNRLPVRSWRACLKAPGSWRLDFIDGGVLVNCSFLSPDQHSYTIDFKNNRAVLTIDTTPKPLVLTLGSDGKTITGPGPVTIDGVVASGYDSGYRDQFGKQLSASEAAASRDPVFDSNGNRVSHSGALPGHSTFSKRQASCPGAEPLDERRRRRRADHADRSAEIHVQRRRQRSADASGHSHAWHLRGLDRIQRPVLPGVRRSWDADPTPRAPIHTRWLRMEPEWASR